MATYRAIWPENRDWTDDHILSAYADVATDEWLESEGLAVDPDDPGQTESCRAYWQATKDSASVAGAAEELADRGLVTWHRSAFAFGVEPERNPAWEANHVHFWDGGERCTVCGADGRA